MAISEKDIETSMKAKGTIAILQAKMQDIATRSEAQLAAKREEIKTIETQRDADLAAIGAKIRAEEAAISALITNV